MFFPYLRKKERASELCQEWLRIKCVGEYLTHKLIKNGRKKGKIMKEF